MRQIRETFSPKSPPRLSPGLTQPNSYEKYISHCDSHECHLTHLTQTSWPPSDPSPIAMDNIWPETPMKTIYPNSHKQSTWPKPLNTTWPYSSENHQYPITPPDPTSFHGSWIRQCSWDWVGGVHWSWDRLFSYPKPHKNYGQSHECHLKHLTWPLTTSDINPRSQEHLPHQTPDRNNTVGHMRVSEDNLGIIFHISP